jgi:hypothetical protein
VRRSVGTRRLVWGSRDRCCHQRQGRAAADAEEHGLRSRERALGIDDPLHLSHRHEPSGEDLGIGQIDVLAEEPQASHAVGVLQFFEKAAPEQPREYPDGEKQPRPITQSGLPNKRRQNTLLRTPSGGRGMIYAYPDRAGGFHTA